MTSGMAGCFFFVFDLILVCSLFGAWLNCNASAQKGNDVNSSSGRLKPRFVQRFQDPFASGSTNFIFLYKKL